MRTLRTLLAFCALAIPAALIGQVSLSVAIGPPAMPVYEQPICPGDGYIWTPGYWGYDESVSDYYWIEGSWVMAPEEGYLWTPGYWGWNDGGYRFNQGYWGTEVGFYGGINYGYGYTGDGYEGGRWDNGHFFYNRSVNNVDRDRNRNVYDSPVSSRNESRVSFNGGTGGIEARATARQESAATQRHVAPVAAQTERMQSARTNPQMHASANHGQPPAAVPSRAVPGPQRAVEPMRSTENELNGGVRAAAPETRQEVAQPRQAVHPNDLTPYVRPEPANSGNARADKKYEKQQDQLITRQTQERNNLQQRQQAEHQPNSSAERNQQLEQKHAQQTQQMSQKHNAQQQQLQQRQPQPKVKKN